MAERPVIVYSVRHNTRIKLAAFVSMAQDRWPQRNISFREIDNGPSGRHAGKGSGRWKWPYATEDRNHQGTPMQNRMATQGQTRWVSFYQRTLSPRNARPTARASRFTTTWGAWIDHRRGPPVLAAGALTLNGLPGQRFWPSPRTSGTWN